MSKKIKALVVFSGGLDSLLAIKTLEAQDIDVTALCFESDFYDAKKAKQSAEELGVNLEVMDIRKEMLELSKNPPNGYGKNMNPCIDCHGMMFRKAFIYMKENGFDVLASGEVLGQRPFSQKKDALNRVMNLAEAEVLRPLSAKLLDETEYEKKGLVIRDKLHSISGRGREGQFVLANEYNLKNYPSPAGGCLLTDPIFSKRFRALLDNWPDCDSGDIGLIKNGRVFWLGNENSKKILMVVGRHKQDNDCLESLAQKGDIVVQLRDINGPITLLRGLNFKVEKMIKVLVPENLDANDFSSDNEDQIIKIAASVTGQYVPKVRGTTIIVDVKNI